MVIVNGIDLEECDKADPGRFRGKYALKDFVLLVGSFREVKNPVLFMELALKLPGVTFVMIGDGLDRSKLAREYHVPIPENVVLLGRQDHGDVMDAMAACRAYVMTSKHEGLPCTLLEAMGVGRPVVVPAHTGCKEVVSGSEYGFLYDLDSLDDLAGKVKEAMASEHIGKKARERVELHFNWKDSAQKLDELYMSV